MTFGSDVSPACRISMSAYASSSLKAKKITDRGTCGGPLLSRHSSRWCQDMPSPAMAVIAVASNLEKTSFLNWISDASCSIVFLKSCGCLLAKSLWKECASIFSVSTAFNSKCQQLTGALSKGQGLVLQTLPHVSLTILPRWTKLLPSHSQPTLTPLGGWGSQS